MSSDTGAKSLLVYYNASEQTKPCAIVFLFANSGYIIFQNNPLNTPKIISLILKIKSSLCQVCLICNLKRQELHKKILIAVTIFNVTDNNILSGFLSVDKETISLNGDRTAVIKVSRTRAG